MTKKELVDRINEVYSKLEELETTLTDASKEIKAIVRIMDDGMPSEPDEIDDSPNEE